MGFIKYFLTASPLQKKLDKYEYKALQAKVDQSLALLEQKRRLITTPVTEAYLNDEHDRDGCILVMRGDCDMFGVNHDREATCKHMSKNGDRICNQNCMYSCFNADYIKQLRQYKQLCEQRNKFWRTKFAKYNKQK